MAGSGIPAGFFVAFSLAAGEQRDLVRSIALAVADEIGREHVLPDEWFGHYLAGDDADLKLQRTCGKRCALVVLYVSRHYGGKPWTLAEHGAIRARQMQARVSCAESGRPARRAPRDAPDDRPEPAEEPRARPQPAGPRGRLPQRRRPPGRIVASVLNVLRPA